MGKRVVTEHSNVTNTTSGKIRKTKRCRVQNITSAPTSDWNYVEDSSSNDSNIVTNDCTPAVETKARLNACLQLMNESPKPVYTLRPSVVNGTILYDLTQKPWRLGRPIGKGNFGEIFLASNILSTPVTNENARYVVKMEPHSNGPLFVEIHCLINTAKQDNSDKKSLPSGIPKYIASGSHYFGDSRYRFLVLPRFDCDLHSLIKNCRVHQKHVLTLAVQIINVLENLHDKGYCHNDIKAQNLMISKCKFMKSGKASIKNSNENSKEYLKIRKTIVRDEYDEKVPTTDSGNSSEQDREDEDEDACTEEEEENADEEDEDVKSDDDDDDDDHDDDDDINSLDTYKTPDNRSSRRRVRNSTVQYSGSNPVRSCRRQNRNSMYEEMVKSHYLRPAKRISYSEFFYEDGLSCKGDEEVDSNSTEEEYSNYKYLSRSKRSTKRAQNRTISTTSVRSTDRKTRQPAPQLKEAHKNHQKQNEEFEVTEECIFLIDFGLASKFIDNGVHRPFVMDQRRAHDGTIEFTSRDAHMGAHSRRSDLECLGYNLIFWSQGYLPWKEAATQHQNEKVHRAKEYLMTDVREMLKQIYGKQVPKFLGEFLQYVGQLSYHERPDYDKCRHIFEREFINLGYELYDMRLVSKEITSTCILVKEEIENKNDIIDMNKTSLSIRKSLSVTPFHERTLSNRVSPKNLRSKSVKKKKKFSWAEILSQDPDQIARERAEKEFDREERLSESVPVTRRYTGRPTYAILRIQNRLKLNGRTTIDTPRDVNTHLNRKRLYNVEEDAEEEISDSSSISSDDGSKYVRLRQKGRRGSGTCAITKSNFSNPCNKKKISSSTTIATKTRISRKSNGKNARSSKQNNYHDTSPSAASRFNRAYNGKHQSASVTPPAPAINGKYERRTRRCLIKTEEESSSDFSTDMFLFNVWNKISNDPILIRKSNNKQEHHQNCMKK